MVIDDVDGLYRYYQCDDPIRLRRSKYPHSQINADRLDPVILKALAEHALSDEHLDQLAAADRAESESNGQPTVEEQQLTELRRKIERGTENLALTDDPQDFATVSNLLAKWREEERKLQKRLAKLRQPKRDRSELAEVLGSLAKLRDKLHLAEPGKLVFAIRATISRITVAVERTHDGERNTTQYSGAIEFVGGHVAPLTDSDIGIDWMWKRVARCVQERPMTIPEVAERLGVGRSTADEALRTAERRGLVVQQPLRLPLSAIWVAAEK